MRARPDGEHSDLFDAFPNSYGSLGYATRLRIELEAVPAVRRAAPRPLRRRRLLAKTDRRDRRDRQSTTASGSTGSTASRSSRGSTT